MVVMDRLQRQSGKKGTRSGATDGKHDPCGPGTLRVHGKVHRMRVDGQRIRKTSEHRELQEEDRDGVESYREGGSCGEENERVLGQRSTPRDAEGEVSSRKE